MTGALASLTDRWHTLFDGKGAKAGRTAVEPLAPGVVAALWAMVAVSLLAGWILVYALVFSGIQQARDNASLYDHLRQSLSEGTIPLDRPIALGAPVALLQFPAAGLDDSVVVEGTGPSELTKGPGHLRTTPMPGQEGVSVLYGRSLTYGGPFGNLHDMAAGTTFTVTTAQGTFSYTVDRVETGQFSVAPLASGQSRLLLETSTGGLFGKSEAVYLQATMKGTAVPAGLNRVASVPHEENEFGRDTSGLMPLVFWLQGLLAAVLLAVWAATKWGRRQAWIIGLPLVVGALWGVSGQVMLLLPNLV